MVSFYSINQLINQISGSIGRLNVTQSICWLIKSMGSTGGQTLLNQSVGQLDDWLVRLSNSTPSIYWSIGTMGYSVGQILLNQSVGQLGRLVNQMVKSYSINLLVNWDDWLIRWSNSTQSIR